MKYLRCLKLARICPVRVSVALAILIGCRLGLNIKNTCNTNNTNDSDDNNGNIDKDNMANDDGKYEEIEADDHYFSTTTNSNGDINNKNKISFKLPEKWLDTTQQEASFVLCLQLLDDPIAIQMLFDSAFIVFCRMIDHTTYSVSLEVVMYVLDKMVAPRRGDWFWGGSEVTADPPTSPFNSAYLASRWKAINEIDFDELIKQKIIQY